MEAAEWGTPPNQVIKSLCQSPPKITAEKMAANHYECGELIQQFHLQNCQNDDEIASAGDNLSMELGSQAGIVESH